MSDITRLEERVKDLEGIAKGLIRVVANLNVLSASPVGVFNPCQFCPRRPGEDHKEECPMGVLERLEKKL